MIPQTRDRAVALSWLADGDPRLVEGVVAKDVRLRWRGGQRLHVKVKRRRTLDAVVIGVAEPPALVLGLFNDTGEIRTLGLCHLPSEAMRGVQPVIDRLGEPLGLMSRWGEQRGRLWRPLPPVLVAEVAASHVDRGRLRQPARFVRWRPDREPEGCRRDQLTLSHA